MTTPTYTVHTYAVFRVKTTGDAPRPGEGLQEFARRTSDAVSTALSGCRLPATAVAGAEVIEYADEISAVLVDQIVDPLGEPKMHWFDDRMESNDGNGTDPARFVRLQKLVESIAATPLEGEPCADAPRGIQSWDAASMIERLEEIINQCRSATAKPASKETA